MLNGLRPIRRPAILPAIATLLLTAAAHPALASCPPDTPPECTIDDQFASGRWDLSQLTGSYTLSGTERFYPFIDDTVVFDDYTTSGTLTVETVGGPAANYVDVACDGTVTGQLSERISGSIDKLVINYCGDSTIGTPTDMDWDVTIERTVSITGNVTGPGQLDLDFDVTTATFDIDGLFAASEDCVFFHGTTSETDFDISGDVEQVTLAGAWSPGQTTWNPTLSPRGSTSWVDDVAHRLKLNGAYDYDCMNLRGDVRDFCLDPELSASTTQPTIQPYNLYFLQTAVTVSQNVSATLEPTTPVITSFALDEPTAYLQDVSVTTSATAEIDWRGQAPGQVEFTYGGTTETVAGSNSVTWDFDAGEAGTTIQAVAIQGSERSQPYSIAAPKVAVPGWAGSPGDWSGLAGVRYEATLDWPVSLETTQTLDTISLFTGLWGIQGSAESTFNTKANSNGSPGSGDLETSASFQAGGNGFDFQMSGTNSTTLACDELTTTGSATGNLAGASWQKTLNPLTVIPGLESAACSLSGLLCGALNAIGVKASASATLTGTATFTGEGSEIQWDGGSLGGTLSGRISANAGLPPPISSLASVSVYGGGSGCLEVMVAPDFQLTKVAGELEIGATASFLGLNVSADESWPFGGGCGRGAEGIVPRGVGSAFVPADGQLATAATLIDGDLVGIAVWSELPAGQARPSGDIRYRIWRAGAWGAIRQLTDDADADTAPAVVFEPNDEPLIVWQRSVGAVPTTTSELPAFADGYELHWATVDLDTELPAATGALTGNSSNDFGPRLVRDGSGAVTLFWQRVAGIEVLGTSALPASILTAEWDASTDTWSAEEAVATGLEGVWGWSATAHSADKQLVALIVDSDGDAGTDIDREVFQISRAAGTWMLPVQVTSNVVADDSPLAAFDADGAPQLLWRRDAEVRELRGDLAVPDQLAFTTEDPSLDEGVGLGFAHGAVAATSGGLVSIWPESTDLLIARDLPSNLQAGWTVPDSDFADGGAQEVHSVSTQAGELLIGWSRRAFSIGNTALEGLVEPFFVRQPAQPMVFADGFESGDSGAWSVTSP